MPGEIQFTVDFEGLDGFMQELRGFTQAVSEEEAIELWSELDDLLEIIRQDYVPIDTGELAASGFVNEPVQTGEGFVIELGFSAEHALIQHERLDYNHKHGQAKYLEDPLAHFLDIFIANRQEA